MHQAISESERKYLFSYSNLLNWCAFVLNALVLKHWVLDYSTDYESKRL